MSALSSWSPGDYKRAGEKHYQTCIQLLSDVDKNRLERGVTLQSVLLDIYYLGGYVIECLLKYYILTEKKTKPSDNKKIRPKDKLTLNELEILKLKGHDIKALSTTANDNGGKDIKFNQKSSLFKNWSEQIRYGLTSSLTQTEVTKYLQEITSVRTQLLN